MNIAIVTGASSGMGQECVRQLDSLFTTGISEIWLIARRADRLNKLGEELKHRFRVLPFDLTSEKDLCELELSLELIKPNVKMLVNASGYGIVGAFKGSDAKEQTGMIRLNCESLTRVTHMVLPYMKKGARIINFASSAAFVPQVYFSVYAASKSYVLSFSRSLNEELKEDGISVTAVCPGPVSTEFFGLAERGGTIFKFKKHFMSEAPKVVRKAMVDSYHRRTVSVYSFWMNAFRLLTKVTPHDIFLSVMKLLSD